MVGVQGLAPPPMDECQSQQAFWRGWMVEGAAGARGEGLPTRGGGPLL